MADPHPALPYSTYTVTVPAEWTDYNGHMHDASYVTALSDANEELFATLGLSEDYRHETQNAFYTVEYNVRYLAECSAGAVLTASTVLVSADRKRMRLRTELVTGDGTVVAVGVSFYLHVDGASGRVCELSEARFEPVAAMLAEHAVLVATAGLQHAGELAQ